jgi:hypothetical protein
MFVSFRKTDGQRVIINYTTANFADETGGRLPESYAILAGKKVGIVGCGSLGSKIGPDSWLEGNGRKPRIPSPAFAVPGCRWGLSDLHATARRSLRRRHAAFRAAARAT